MVSIYWQYLVSSRQIVMPLVVALVAVVGLVIAVPSNASGPRDCDTNAILRCGAYSISELKQKYDQADSTARRVFDFYGIERADFNHMVEGVVTKSGRVIVNGRTVATNVLSSGRHPTANSQPIPGANAYTRPPSDSFVSSSLAAYVYMPGGQFHYAILKSCGNPVAEKPGIKRNVELIQGKTSAPAPGTTVRPGNHIIYQMSVKNIGNTQARTVSIMDLIPPGTDFLANSLSVVAPTPPADVLRFDNAANKVVAVWDTVPPGGERTIRFKVRINSGVTDGHNICNFATIDAQEVPPRQTERICHPIRVPEPEPPPEPQPRPTARCVRLTATRLGELTFRFTGRASVNDEAAIRGYTIDFGDGQLQTINTSATEVSFTHTYQRPTDNVVHQASLTAHTSLGDVDSSACRQPVRLAGEEPEPEPEFACLSLAASPARGQAPLEVTLTAQAEASGGAEIVGYGFDIDGDGSVDRTVSTSSSTAAITETYTDSATAQVRVATTEGTTGFVADCRQPITVLEEPPATIICSGLSREAEEQKRTFTFTIHTLGEAEPRGFIFEVDGQRRARQPSPTLTEQFAPGSHTVRAAVVRPDGSQTDFSDCVNRFSLERPPAPPEEELPVTGPAEVVSAAIGTTTLGKGLQLWIQSRRRLTRTMLGLS